MKWLYVPIVTIVITLLTLVILLPSTSNQHKKINDMRCSSFIRMDLSINKNQKSLIDAVFNFKRNEGKAFLLVNGVTTSEHGQTIISREVSLNTVSVDERSGYEYSITRTDTGPTDNTPDVIFDSLLSEFSGDNKSLFLNDTVPQGDAILVGGPYSNLFMCVRY